MVEYAYLYLVTVLTVQLIQTNICSKMFRYHNSGTLEMMWIIAFCFVSIAAPVANCQIDSPSCRELDDEEFLFTGNCSGTWLDNIDKTVMHVLEQNRNFVHVMRNLNKRFYVIATHCSYKQWVQWDDNLLRPNDRTLCGIRMINNFNPNLPLDAQAKIAITVDMQFALNLTFMYFKADASYQDVCPDIGVRIMFHYGNATCFSNPKQGVCGYRHPWSVVIPSGRVQVIVRCVQLINPLKFHVAYQVVEKCRQLMRQKVAHILKSRFVRGE